MQETEKWFLISVYQRRVLLALAALFLVLFLALVLFSIFVWIALSLPGFRLPETSNDISWGLPAKVAHFIVLCIATSVIFFFHLYRCSTETNIPTRRIQALWECISPMRNLHHSAYMIITALAAHCFLVISFDSSPWIQKAEDGPLLYGERHWFTVGAGFYLGLLFGLKYYNKGVYLLDFPVVQQQARFLTIKYSLRQQVLDSLVSPSFWLYWYYLIYFFLGSAFNSRILRIFIDLESPPADEGLSSWTGLLDPSLFAITWLTCSFLSWLWVSLIILFKEIFTQQVEFAINTELEATHHHSLSNCLSTDSRYIKFLAFLDLRILAENSPARRREIFSISTPGGRPKYWPTISNACLSTIKDFLSKLENPTPSPPLKKGPFPADLPIPHSGLKRIHIYQPSGISGFSSIPSPPPTVLEVVKTKVLEWWNQRPLVQYLFGEVPEAKILRVFSQSQPVVWAIEALCFLVKASHSEDTFGVVQKNLSEIMTTLLSLQTVLDRHPSGAMRRPMFAAASPLARKDAQLRHALKTALNLGLYHIVLAFGKDLILGVPLSIEHRNCLEQYLTFAS